MVAHGMLQVQFSQCSTPRALVELGKACVALKPQDRPTAAQMLTRLQFVLKRSYPMAFESRS